MANSRTVVGVNSPLKATKQTTATNRVFRNSKSHGGVSNGVRPVPFLACAAASFAALRWKPTITLAEEAVVIDESPEQLIGRFRERLGAGDDVIVAHSDRIVRGFHGRAGRFRYDTIEVITFGPSSITFEHLDGPFARCAELFEFARRTTGTSISHSGTFALRGGLWTWPLARTAVKSAFERHVHDHLASLRDELADRSTSEVGSDER